MHAPAPALGFLRLTRLALVAADRGVGGEGGGGGRGGKRREEEGGDGKRKERERERGRANKASEVSPLLADPLC